MGISPSQLSGPNLIDGLKCPRSFGSTTIAAFTTFAPKLERARAEQRQRQFDDFFTSTDQMQSERHLKLHFTSCSLLQLMLLCRVGFRANHAVTVAAAAPAKAAVPIWPDLVLSAVFLSLLMIQTPADTYRGR